MSIIMMHQLQARGAFERKDFQKAETYFLRAEKPDLAAKFYKVSHHYSNTR
jgi:intraflagellar transport protein 172